MPITLNWRDALAESCHMRDFGDVSTSDQLALGRLTLGSRRSTIYP